MNPVARAVRLDLVAADVRRLILKTKKLESPHVVSYGMTIDDLARVSVGAAFGLSDQ